MSTVSIEVARALVAEASAKAVEIGYKRALVDAENFGGQEWFSQGEAAKYCGVSTKTIISWENSNRIERDTSDGVRNVRYHRSVLDPNRQR